MDSHDRERLTNLVFETWSVYLGNGDAVQILQEYAFLELLVWTAAASNKNAVLLLEVRIHGI